MGLQGSDYHSREIESINPIEHLSKPNELIKIFFKSGAEKRFPFLMIEKLNYTQLNKPQLLKQSINNNPKIWKTMLFKLATEYGHKVKSKKEEKIINDFIEFINSTNPDIVNEVNEQLEIETFPVLEDTFFWYDNDSDDEDDDDSDDYDDY